jgi:hypothetical protein
LQQAVDPAARRVQTRAQVVALVRHGRELRRQQRVGALQLLVSKKQALDPVCKFLDRGHDAPARGVSWRIVGVAFAPTALLRINALVPVKVFMPSQLNGKRAPDRSNDLPGQTALPPQRYGGRRGPPARQRRRSHH